jgi:general stress protein 26
MAHEDHTDRSQAELVDRVWELADKIRVCMFITFDGSAPRARPLSASVSREEEAIYFLTSVRSAKDGEIERHDRVTLAFVDKGANKYVTITGAGTVSNDRQKIRNIWTPFAKAWWDSADDPDIRLITVLPHEAELWDGPNALVAGAVLLGSAVTGGKPSLGENAKVDL